MADELQRRWREKRGVKNSATTLTSTRLSNVQDEIPDRWDALLPGQPASIPHCGIREYLSMVPVRQPILDLSSSSVRSY
jgi:hypothetical protein